ncbi:serine/threonine protein kinase [Streptomyces sp. NBC_00249]|uniref:serine/threonine-protein kinase n=1 Tax=Streptomyces sp. NBC_00249 TaxID=2975690 RepID=UPI00225931C2|nr:serine/threonine-protein kinase [Streptomyces sp. NBC_00249]MCX5193606.1 serine/threonine protein kinase [Streptomyces sp. NBC_00249]
MTAGEANGGELVGKVLGGRYRVTAIVGRGGMGVVARAVDELLDREVAVKILRAYTDASATELADLRTRMRREAQAAARIRHSGVVTVHDVTEDQGLPVIVMELVDGPSLDDVLTKRGTLEPREAAAIGVKLMDALDAAHRAGVLHRDVKPGNVLLEHGGRVVLTDFGIATLEASGDDAMAKLTQSGQIVGSLDYLPPERAQGREPGPASDIWSLGMTLYAAVEGTSPFRRTSAWSMMSAIVNDPLPEPRLAGPLAPVLMALMAKEPEDRPTADQARGMLEDVASGRTVHSASAGPTSTPTVVPGAGAAAAAAVAPPAGFGPPLFPQPTPQPQPPYAGYPQPGVPVAGPAGAGGVPTPETSRSVARRTRSRGNTLIASAAAVVLLAAGAGITYALTAEEGGTAVEGSQAAPPGVSSPAGSHRPTAGSSPSAAGSSGASAQPSPSKTTARPTKTPASPEAKPSSTVKEPTPVSTACTGWAHQNRSNGYGYLADDNHLFTGPYKECSYVTFAKTGAKLFYHCYITNAHGNKWIYARIEGTDAEGWISSDHFTRESGTLVRC